MSSQRNEDILRTTSTPKRRRLGTRRTIKDIASTKNHVRNKFLPSHLQEVPENAVQAIDCDSPSLPCNQVKYLSDSANNTREGINCSISITDSSFILDKEDSEPSVVSHNKVILQPQIVKEVENLFDDMFTSSLEQVASQQNDTDEELLTSRCEKHFREEINDGFEAINQSINIIKNDRDSFFDTKDSFLLEVDDLTQAERSNKINYVIKSENVEKMYVPQESFYHLPMITKGLFKTYRKIDKLYG